MGKEQGEKTAYMIQKERADGAEARVAELTKEIDALQPLKSIESELNQVKLDLTKARKDLTAANESLTKFKSDNEKLTKDLRALNEGRQNLTGINEELTKVKDKLNTVKSENEKLNQQSEKLNQINERLKTDLDDLTAVNADLKKQIGSLTDQVANLTKANQKLTEINTELNWDSQELNRIKEGRDMWRSVGRVLLNILMVFTALAASFANVIHLGERYLALIQNPTDLDRIVCYVPMTVFDLCIFFFAIYGKAPLARVFAGAIMFIVFTKLATPFVGFSATSEYVERFLVGLAYSGFLAFVSVVMSEVLADKINGKLK